MLVQSGYNVRNQAIVIYLFRRTMPGHIKLGASQVPDPDPLPYLMVSAEMRRKDMAKPYDSKRAVWTPDGMGGYVEGVVQSDDGEKATVLLGHEVPEVFYCP